MTPKEFAAIRAAAGLTQQAIADYLGVLLRSAQRYEYGERPIPKPIAKLMRMLAESPSIAARDGPDAS